MNQMGWLESSTTGVLKWILADPDQIVPGSSIIIKQYIQSMMSTRVGHIRRFVHVAPQNPLMANPVKVCYSTFLFEGP